MTEVFNIGEDIYDFINKIKPDDKNGIKDLVEYVHYKALLESFTYIIENVNSENLEFLLPDYIEVISKIQVIINNIERNVCS